MLQYVCLATSNFQKKLQDSSDSADMQRWGVFFSFLTPWECLDLGWSGLTGTWWLNYAFHKRTINNTKALALTEKAMNSSCGHFGFSSWLHYPQLPFTDRRPSLVVQPYCSYERLVIWPWRKWVCLHWFCKKYPYHTQRTSKRSVDFCPTAVWSWHVLIGLMDDHWEVTPRCWVFHSLCWINCHAVRRTERGGTHFKGQIKVAPAELVPLIWKINQKLHCDDHKCCLTVYWVCTPGVIFVSPWAKFVGCYYDVNLESPPHTLTFTVLLPSLNSRNIPPWGLLVPPFDTFMVCHEISRRS